MTHPHQMTDPTAIKEFVLGGNSTVTLVSDKTGTRYTFRVKSPRGKKNPHFVSVMYGSDNEGEFAYMGTIFEDGTYACGRKSTLDKDDIRQRAWRFFWQFIVNERMPPDVQVWHEGRCGRCQRKLTVPQSIASGFGPECIEIVASRRQRELAV